MVNNVLEFSTCNKSITKSPNHILAAQIKQKLGMTKGKCVEISSDGGQMGNAFAEVSELEVYLYNSSELSLGIAGIRVGITESRDRMTILSGESCYLPIENDSMDFVIGIKSIWSISDYCKGVIDMYIDTKLPGFKLRFAQEIDIGLILGFVKELAAYENLLNEVGATEESLMDAIFKRKIAEVVIGEYEEKPVCFALYYYSLSTFIGSPGIFIEDLFVKPEMRGKGMGKILLSYLATLAKERACWGLEWACLNWNEPSIKFYKGLGSVPRDEWTMYRLRGNDLERLAGSF